MDIEQMNDMRRQFMNGELNFPVGSHEAVAKVLGLTIEEVQKVREKRNEEARRRVKTREAVDAESVKHTVWDNRGCDLLQLGNRLTVGQLKAIIQELPDDMDVYTHQYVASVGMECLPCETIKIAESWKLGTEDDKHNIMVME